MSEASHEYRIPILISPIQSLATLRGDKLEDYRVHCRIDREIARAQFVMSADPAPAYIQSE